ncbi:MAG: hypothetical protein LUG88_08690 [Clostridia bacterium]|nr:hypothetical protein [Clostridia bacterium]
MRGAKIRIISLALALVSLALCFFSCAEKTIAEDDGTAGADNEASVSKIAEAIGISDAEAETLYILLTMTGLEGEIKYVTSWNDPDTGEIYYRVRTNTGKREIYISEESTYGYIITDGDTVYSLSDAAPDITSDDIIEENYDKNTENAETDAPETTASANTTASVDTTTTDADTSMDSDTSENTEVTEATETTAEDTSAPSKLIEIVLNTSSKKCHYPTCSAVSRMSDENKETIYVSSLDEVFAMGYEPCGICMKGVG